MPKFILYVNGEAKEVFQGTAAEAHNRAREIWEEEADQDYSVEPYSKKVAIEDGLEEADEE